MAIRVLLNNNLRSIYESVDNVIELISGGCLMFYVYLPLNWNILYECLVEKYEF